jgi:hypothetical protein
MLSLPFPKPYRSNCVRAGVRLGVLQWSLLSKSGLGVKAVRYRPIGDTGAGAECLTSYDQSRIKLSNALIYVIASILRITKKLSFAASALTNF